METRDSLWTNVTLRPFYDAVAIMLKQGHTIWQSRGWKLIIYGQRCYSVSFNLQDFLHCVVFYISLTTFPPLSSMSLSADHLFLRPHTSKPPPTPTPSPPPLYFDTLAILVTPCEHWGFSNPSTWGQPPWISVWNLGEFEFASCDMVRVMQSTSSQPIHIHMGSTFINPGRGRWR